ncbi:MAG: protein kinase [Myxococcales bacterium]|nr:protein kinase [Myxococcales bacterium]
MARPLRRDGFAWICSLPSSIVLLACLALPQVRDCHGHVKTAADNGTSPLLVVMAMIALAPLAWRWPVLRGAVSLLAIVAGMLAVMSSVLVLPVAIYCVIARPWRSTEQFVAFVCGCIALVFVLVFPLIGLFSTWMYGATLTWGTGCVVLVASFAWASGARVRASMLPLAAREPAPAPERVLSPSPAALEVSPRIPAQIGDYTIECELGAGGMARVYRGRHRHLETSHALKVLDPAYRQMPEARQRFLDEAKIQAKVLCHPNIVKVTNIVATPEHAALVMEYVEGASLETELSSLQGDPAEITRIMLGILSAVEHAHQAGVIHRDLKPANVLLEGPGRIPRVTDFGIAKVTSDGYLPSSSTAGGARMGTLAYMSPEQIRGPRHVTAQSDVFSLGIVLYEMTTGRLPFEGESDYALMDAIVRGAYYLPPVIDPQIARVIRTALEPEPAARYASCAQMASALVRR